jgi:hypothetical protein
VGPISALTLTEELIVKKSIEFFSDGEPCFIHRGAVATRLFLEIDKALLTLAPDGADEIRVDALSALCPGYFDAYPKAAFIRMADPNTAPLRKRKEEGAPP